MTDTLPDQAWGSVRLDPQFSSPVVPNGHQPRRRVRGLTLRRVPSAALTAQVLGSGGTLAAIAGLTHNPWWAMLVAGVGAVVVGALHEAGLLSASKT